MKNLNTFIATFVLCFSYYGVSEELPRGPNGKPDLNGVWQVLNTANYDLEAHPARAAMQLVEGLVVPVPHPDILALGAVGSVPAGLSVVVGGKIPVRKLHVQGFSK